jgi:hypothetical protein
MCNIAPKSIRLFLLSALLVTLLALEFTGSALWAQERSVSVSRPAVASRPSGVPPEFIITPFGYFHPSCVLQLNKGESVDDSGLLHRTDGTTKQVGPCLYPHFRTSGELFSHPRTAGNADAGNGTNQSVQGSQTQKAAPGWIGHSWMETSNVITSSSYGQLISTWTVPPAPLINDGQTVYLFPGFQDATADNTGVYSIVQPVIGYLSNGAWYMSSWNCCPAGTANYNGEVGINPGDTIVGTVAMTCAAGTANCTTWNVITEDQTTNQSTSLTGTPSDGQTFNWAFGATLEVYDIQQCLDYPPNASMSMNTVLYDVNLNPISAPQWSPWIIAGPDSGVQPQCNYGVTISGNQTTLDYGTAGAGFGLGVTPPAAIAVNQGNSATGAIAITDINGFTGPVSLSVSTQPTGITAELAPGASFNTYVLTLSATSAAVLTGTNSPASLTLTASGSGVPTQTFPVNVLVNPPQTGGTGITVDLTTTFNVYGFFDDSYSMYANDMYSQVLDGSGDAYSANQLSPPGTAPMGLNLNGVQFSFGAPNQQNTVHGTGSPITLPATEATSLQLLGAGVNSRQLSQTVTVTYTDATTQTFTQTFHDWNGSGSPCVSYDPCTGGESVAEVMPYRDTYWGTGNGIFYLYSYTFALNPSKTVSSLTLPNNSNVAVLAATLVPSPSNPTVTVAPTSLAFGNVPVNTESLYQGITVTNTGASPLTINSVMLTGTNPSQFVISANYCPATLAAGASCSVHLHFYPQVTGAASASLTVTDNATGSPQSVSLTGTATAPVVSLSTTSLVFGNVPVNTESIYQAVTVTNTGNSALTIDSVALTGTNPTQFVISANYCPTSLAAGASCAVHLHFYPQVTGPASASLTVTDNATDSPESVSLTGTGTAPAVSLSTTGLAFGNVTVNTESVYQAVTVTNTGNGALTIGSIALTGSNPAQFLISANYCPGSLAAGASCAVHLHFSPQVSGAAAAALTITDNATDSPESVTLTGTGTVPAASLSTTNLAFGNVPVNTESVYQGITLTNTGSSSLTIQSIALTGTNPTQFLISANYCPKSLAAGASCAVHLHFYPQVTGAASAALSIADNATGSPQSVTLTGTGD